MVKEFITKLKEIKNIEKGILEIMYIFFKLCFMLLILSSLTLLFYILNPISYIIFESGIILFRTSLTFLVFTFMSGIVTNNVKKGLD